jgi:CheY-like chemotaxis protein
VLVVEDDPDCARLLGTFIQSKGHHPFLAHDGRAALELADQFPPDVALLDVELPGELDGYEVGRQLRARSGAKRPLLVTMTGIAPEPPADDCFDLHLLKPIDPDKLMGLLDRFRATVFPAPPP